MEIRRSLVHPICRLFVLNIGITIYAFYLDCRFWDAFLGLLLPAGFLLVLAEDLRSGVASSNHGVFPKAIRPLGYWTHVAITTILYLFTSAAPICARYFAPASH